MQKISVPADAYREAKVEAAKRGITLAAFVAIAIKHELEAAK